ncbi:NAD-glutamate dehydrogenase [Sandarakinorhabdus sp.]|uniref:NAD-glutamate dehydrogenase n=1 Tax=Sandarakinorhabdus sp. TaxID=1916663 RepID=UPI0035675EB2
MTEQIRPSTTAAPVHTPQSLALAGCLFARALPGEIEGLDDAGRAAVASFMADAAAQRGIDQPVIHIDPLSDDGARRLRLAIIGEDRPFLVDSTAAAVTAAGVDIHRLLHPIVDVRRDDDGRLLEVFGPGKNAAPLPGHTRESMIYMEIEQVGTKTRAALEASLAQVLADVRAAVTDWQAMLALLRVSVRALSDNPPPLAPHRTAEAIAFLEWLAADNFTLLGARHYRIEGDLDDPAMEVASDGGLGLLADPDYPVWTGTRGPADTPRALKALLASPEPLLITRAGAVVTVHRRVNGDLVAVKGFDRQGRVVSETRFLGMYTSAALGTSPRQVPLLRRKVGEIIDALGFGDGGHSAKALVHVLESFPRMELFEASPDQLKAMALGLLSLLDRPRPKLFARPDPFGRFVSALVYVPRDVYTSRLREAAGQMLAQELKGSIARYEVELREEGLARVHYVVDVADAASFTADQEAALDRRLRQLVRGWEEDLEAALAELTTPTRAARLARSHGRAFSPSYRAQHQPAEAAADIMALAELSDENQRSVRLMAGDVAGPVPGQLRLKIYRLGRIIPLSEAVPVLENFGLRVIEEYPFDLAGGQLGWVHDFLAEVPDPVLLADLDGLAARVAPALTDVLTGAQENDGFNALILSCGLEAQEAALLRAWFRYLRQTGATYGVMTVVDALKRYPAITRELVTLFAARFGPPAAHRAETTADSLADRDAAQDQVLARIDAGLADVASIDDDRILRLYRAVMLATLRTNFYVPGGPEAMAFKLDSSAVPGLPPPVPYREIWVYSPRVEGIHLRGGPIARGGLRWSDRRDDFRTEVLGLVKAQKVKNTVIVPTGAKGGFYPKQLPPASNRDAWLAEGTEAYRVYIRALLSITDNLDVAGTVLPPAGVVCHDAPDPYLVVAADKGTATFSDTANAIAENHGFWLGDAFASGGGNGYDHKAMGITANGAWISVQRHFRELGVDVQTETVRVAGVGDMSGDVFGNGLLLSRAVALAAAFDHRHIFLDPAPDIAVAYAERQRMFALPRSSWDDYDKALISQGGGVFSRSLKSIPLSRQVQAMLGVSVDVMAPTELLSAILKMQVDLIWFGGIGTYVKASTESNADAGDRANDALRVDARDLRARAIGEGANLGLTQAARIEFARAGGRINTDFIDNSAGVDCSDHEVNIKIALNGEVAAGRLARPDRDALLKSMTDDVAELVLRDNHLQTQAISLAETGGAAAVPVFQRLIQALEGRVGLDRRVEGLPGDDVLSQRAQAGEGLSRPELAVVMAYAKMAAYDVLVTSDVVDDPLLEADLIAAFPTAMQAAHRDAILHHRLRRELVATKLANELINRTGLSAPFELAEELGAGIADIARAFVAARQLFGFAGMWQAIDTAAVPVTSANALHLAAQGVLRAQMADLVRLGGGRNASALVAAIAPGLKALGGSIEKLVKAEVRGQLERSAAQLAAAGAPADLARSIVHVEAMDGAVGVSLLAAERQLNVAATAQAYTMLGEVAGLDWARGAAAALNPADPWERLLTAALVRDFEQIRLDLLRHIVPEGSNPVQVLALWLEAHSTRVARIAASIARARDGGMVSAAMLAHIAGQARAALT